MSSSSETGPRCSSPVDSDLSGSDGTKPNPNRELMQNGCSNDKLSYIIPDRYLACAALFTTMHVVMHLLAPALQHLKNHLHNHIASCKHTCMMLRNFINSLLIATCTEKLQTDIFLSFLRSMCVECLCGKKGSSRGIGQFLLQQLRKWWRGRKDRVHFQWDGYHGDHHHRCREGDYPADCGCKKWEGSLHKVLILMHREEAAALSGVSTLSCCFPPRVFFCPLF